MTENIVRLAVDNLAVDKLTREQLASAPFKAEQAFNTYKRREAHERMLRDLSISTRMCCGILGMSKAKVIQSIREFQEDAEGKKEMDELFDSFDQGIELAQTMLEVITKAKRRYMVALANVFDEEGRLVKPSA